MSNQTQQHTLQAMANNYRNGHSWDHLDGEVCTKAADEIKQLRDKLERAEAFLTDIQQETRTGNIYSVSFKIGKYFANQSTNVQEV